MVAWGDRLAVAVVLCVVIAAEPVAAQGSGAVTEPGSTPASASVPVPVPVPVKASVLVAPVQGSEALRVQHGDRVAGAVRRALDARGYQETGSQELLGRAIVACQTPECVEQALDAAHASFAIVPAIWSRATGGEELTLTLIQKSGRNLNANGVLDDDLPGTAATLVDELLEQQVASVVATPSAAAATAETVAPSHPHAWKAGPIILIAGGAGAVIAVGVAAGIRNDTQQFNTAGVATWSAVGAAAIAGGIAWWVVGEKRRRQKAEPAAALATEIAFRPTGIDLRLRF
jgi:hypothetical protein